MLSKRAKYAIKTILYLQDHVEDKPLSAKLISVNENIPYKFLENILRDLKTHQLVKSVRGAEGGYILAKDPSEITIAQIMRVVDGPIALIPCVSERFYESCGECTDEKTCRIRKLFSELRNEMLPILERPITTLAKDGSFS
ncbi:Rrf2 family transcriptional regulator [Algoriphagus sp. D3-2-R+10]|uniref:RrF2 family transcriptional regulator n=1 Tax=Algoriphagus aurantiacus TaxID=3103948 RepID=UPI002B3E869B|nr:Rrf2 family transcriptional regulator [Algoriphagus sp. D3-2-R+10]MEB2774122.1 Rrf2 family transcriptional regulator [Algoriphagus sp. D3-2-R+10]